MNEKYLEAVLNALGEKITSLESELTIKDYQIKELKKALEQAEAHIKKG